jgi:hypothetical protein
LIPYNSGVLKKLDNYYNHDGYTCDLSYPNIPSKAIHSVYGIQARNAGASGVANKLFVSLLFSDPDVSV